MPVKLGPRLAVENEARIEIIPLIDIMFFLLAAFMLVSLSMVNLKNVKVDLPTATVSSPETKRDFVNISVDKAGAAFLDAKPVGQNELAIMLANIKRTNDSVRVLVSGDKEARHGAVIQVLDIVRSAGIEKVAFEIREPAEGNR
jgi:biopolymer transport protein ExbD